jgi:hypothetical protein
MERSKSSSKPKAKSAGAKTVAASRSVKSKKVSDSRSHPGEEEIRKKAQELYNERIFRGEHGSAEDDWINAERLLRP